MALFGLEFHTLNDLFINQLKDTYDAEKQLTQALPLMADAANSPELKKAFSDHLTQTLTHITRLEQVFERINVPPKRESCPAMSGLIKEGDHIISAKGDSQVRDAGLIAAAQKAEHYEIASYGTLRNFAQRLGLSDVAQTLQQTLDEEGEADKKLTRIAESQVNPGAMMA